MQRITLEMDRIARGEHYDPFQVLGPHLVRQKGKKSVLIRAFLPQAEEALVLPSGDSEQPMRRTAPDGFFEATFPDCDHVFPYRFKVIPQSGPAALVDDPYRFPPQLSEFDLYLIGEGSHRNLYDRLGAHPHEVE